MNHKKIAKQLVDVTKTVFYKTFNTITLQEDNPEKFFFSFVDKNPLFHDNTKEAIQEYILASRERRLHFKTHDDEGNEKSPKYLMSSHFHYRNK